MTIPGTRVFSLPIAAVYLAGVVGFVGYTRTSLDSFAESHRTAFTFWDVVLELVGSGYVVSYWVVPVALWCILRQFHGNARPEQLIRYATRTDWALAQGLQSLPWIAGVVGVLLGVALVAASGHPFTWAWGGAAADSEVVLQLPELTPSLPLPVLSVVLQVLALVATLVALTVVTAGVATSPGRPRAVAVTAVALVLWNIISFRADGWFSDILGVATYALPWRSERALSFGPGGGVMVLLVAGALTYSSARRLEVRRPRPGDVPAIAVAITMGAATLLALTSTVPSGEEQMVARLLLQGVATDGVSLLHYLASLILVLVPAILVHRNLVDSLSGRRFAEMIRLHSPARWYFRQAVAAALFCGAYGLAMAIWATLLVGARLSAPPDAHSLLLIGLWGVALSAQALVVTVMLALGTVAARRVEGGAYAIGALVVLEWPLGAVSRWVPAGQASLARMTDLSATPSTLVQPLPLIVLAAWLIVLSAATAVLFNRTRGEIF